MAVWLDARASRNAARASGGPSPRAERQAHLALSALLAENDRLARKVASRFRWAEAFEFDDLLQEARDGMMHAAEKYDPTAGANFGSYSWAWMAQRIWRAIANTGETVRLPVGIVDLKRRVRKTAEGLGRGGAVSDERISAVLGVSAKAVSLVRSLRRPTSLDAPIKPGDAESETLHSVLADERCEDLAEAMHEAGLSARVSIALHSLTAYEEAFIRARFGLDGEPCTLEQIGQQWGITRERARQVEKRLLCKLRAPCEAMRKLRRLEEEVA